MLLIISNETHSRIVVNNKRELGGKEILLGIGGLFAGLTAGIWYLFSGNDEAVFEYAELIK